MSKHRADVRPTDLSATKFFLTRITFHFFAFSFWLSWIFVAVRGLFIVVASPAGELKSSAPGSSTQGQQLRCTRACRSAAHGAFPDPCSGRWVPNHHTSREAPTVCFILMD